VIGGVPVKLARAAVPFPGLDAAGSGVAFASGFFPGGDWLGLFWAGRRFAAGQVAFDGSARLSGLP